MKRSDLIRIIQNRHGALSRKEAEHILNSLLRGIEEGLAKGEEIHIANLGTFNTTQRKAWEATHPSTGEKSRFSSRTMATFQPATSLLKKLNKGHD